MYRGVNKEQFFRFLALGILIQLYAYFLFHTLFGDFHNVILRYGWLHFTASYFPKFFPPLIFAIYLLLRHNTSFWKTVCTKVAWGFVGAGVVFPLIVTPLYFSANSPVMYISFSRSGFYEWSWPALLSWNLIFLASYFLAYRKTIDTAFSFAFSVLLISAGGMFYELPVFMRMEYGYYLHESYPFVLGTEFFSMAFLLIMAWLRKWRPNKIFALTLTTFLVHGVLWHFNPALLASINYADFAWWFPRVIGVLPLLSLTTGFQHD